MYHSLQLHELHYARLPCPSCTPGAYSNSCPLNHWCHPTISSSVIPFSSCLHSFPTRRSSDLVCGCERWTIKKAEHWRIDAFQLWCWRRLLRVPWTARRSNQSILKEISPEYYWKDWCWSWNPNSLATWCEELTHRKRLWCWERPRAGREGDDRGWDGWMASLT